MSWIKPAPTTASGDELQRYLLDTTVDVSLNVFFVMEIPARTVSNAYQDGYGRLFYTQYIGRA